MLEEMQLPDAVKRPASRLMNSIQVADAMLQAVKAGARAEGFVMALASLKALSQNDLEALESCFSQATEQRLRELAG